MQLYPVLISFYDDEDPGVLINLAFVPRVGDLFPTPCGNHDARVTYIWPIIDPAPGAPVAEIQCELVTP